MKKLLAILLGITMLFGMAVTGTAEAATGADVKGTGVPLTVTPTPATPAARNG